MVADTPPSTDRARRIPIGPAFWVATALYTLLALVMAFIPLLDLLAYEFCAVLGLEVSALAGPVAIGVLRRSPPEAPFKRLVLTALAANGVTLVAPLAIILLNALRVQNCNLGVGLLFYLLLPVVTALIFTLWGLAVGLIIRRRWLAGLAYAASWLAIALWNIWEAWTGPQMDSYNQLLGWVAGPIYDDVVEPSGVLLASRLFGLAWALFALGAVLAWTAACKRRWAVAAAGLGLICGTGLWVCDGELGFGRSASTVERELSATTTTPHFVIHHPPELSDEKAALLARDHEFRLAQIESDLGRRSLPPIHSWVFQGPDQKRRLVGAGRTQYAKPWLYTMCLNGSAFPHGTLKHELVHVFAGAFGAWPFRASSRGVWINPGLTEGIAVAVDWGGSKFDRHTWSAALRRIDRAPDIESLFGPLGFWSAAAGRSYTLAGSFVRYLLDTHGPEPFVQAYMAGDLSGHYPKSPEELFADWRAYLDAIPLDEGTLEVARLMFSSESVFKRTCAHEVAKLRKRAVRQLADNRPEAATETVALILEHLPGDAQALEFQIEIRLKQDRLEDAKAIAEALLATETMSRAAKARLQGRLGDLLLDHGHPELVAKAQKQMLEAHLTDHNDRLALVKLQALEQGSSGRPILELLKTGKLDPPAAFDLFEAATARPDWGTAWYLIGRQFYNREHFDRAVTFLDRAGRKGLGHPALAAENLRLLAIGYYRSGIEAEDEEVRRRHTANSAAVLAVMTQFPRHQGELLQAADWLDRIDHDRTTSLVHETRRPQATP